LNEDERRFWFASAACCATKARRTLPYQEDGDDAPVAFLVDGYPTHVDFKRPEIHDCANGMEHSAHTKVR